MSSRSSSEFGVELALGENVGDAAADAGRRQRQAGPQALEPGRFRTTAAQIRRRSGGAAASARRRRFDGWRGHYLWRRLKPRKEFRPRAAALPSRGSAAGRGAAAPPPNSRRINPGFAVLSPLSLNACHPLAVAGSARPSAAAPRRPAGGPLSPALRARRTTGAGANSSPTMRSMVERATAPPCPGPIHLVRPPAPMRAGLLWLPMSS